jgi:hypothetical protein
MTLTVVREQVYMIIMRDIVNKLFASGIMLLPIPIVMRAIQLRVMRRETHLVVLGAAMLPLCLLRSLSALAKVSWAGMAGVVYLMCFTGYRWAAGTSWGVGRYSRYVLGGREVL